ncbi:MAG: DNA-methyltransferase [Pseudomonadota bacterium]
MEFKLFEHDALEVLKSLEDNSIDLVITDPPYESLEKHRKVGTTTRLKNSKSSSNNWFEIFPNERLQELMEELYRVLCKNSHCYIFCDQETMFFLKPLGEKAGFKFWKPIVWDKVKIGMGYHYRARYEMILFFEKGKRKLSNLGVPDVLAYPRVHRGYPTEKPVELATVLVNQSSLVGETVLDPFCGSGAFGVAAVKNKRRFIGADTSGDATSMTKERLEGLVD